MSEIINYPPNSHKSKSEETTEKPKRVEKVVTGKTVTKKKTEARKFADIFVAGDVSNVKEYIVTEVVVPAVKNTISSIVRDGIDMILFGSTKREGGKRPTASYVSYNNYSNRDESRTASASRTVYRYDDIIFQTRGDAEMVLSQMDAIIEKYDMVSVADMYELADITGNYTDHKYGWYDLRSAELVRVRDGYTIKLPKAQPLK